MRIMITRGGIFRNGTDMVPVGTELDVPDDFEKWGGKWERVEQPRQGTLEVATPAKADEPDKTVEPPKPEVSEDLELLYLRAEFEKRFGEKPHPRMKAETIRSRLNAEE